MKFIDGDEEAHCWGCGEKGHRMKNCPMLKRSRVVLK